MLGSALIYLLYLAKVLRFGSDLDESFWGAGIGFVLVLIVSVLVTLVTTPKPIADLEGLVYGVGRTDLTGDAVVGDRVWYRSPLLLGAGALILAIAFYLPFW
jgi:SSS family solute:Na+ symporter